MPSRRTFIASGTALGISLFVTGRAKAAPLVSVTYGPATPSYAHTAVAIEKGFFKDEGVEHKLVLTDSGANARQMMASREAMVLHNDASQPLFLANRGRRCKMILGTEMIASFSNVVVRKDLYDAGITTIDALGNYKRPGGGKTVVAATAIGSGTWMFGTYLFEKRKVDRNINWVGGGGPQTLLAGLQSKQFDAIMAAPSWVIDAEAKDFGRVIYDVRKPGVFANDFGGTLPVLVYSALEETIESDGPALQSFVTAVMKGMAWMKTAPVDEVYALIGPKYFGGVSPAACKVDLAFDRETWAFDGRVSKEDFARGAPVWFRQSTDIKPTTYEDMVDMRFVEAAAKKIKA